MSILVDFIIFQLNNQKDIAQLSYFAHCNWSSSKLETNIQSLSVVMQEKIDFTSQNMVFSIEV